MYNCGRPSRVQSQKAAWCHRWQVVCVCGGMQNATNVFAKLVRPVGTSPSPSMEIVIIVVLVTSSPLTPPKNHTLATTLHEFVKIM